MKLSKTQIIISKVELFNLVRKANGLRGRQVITEYWSDGGDDWIFGSNAKGGYGESLTFHYATDKDLLKDIAPDYTSITQVSFNAWELK
jgi:hypothetical protein